LDSFFFGRARWDSSITHWANAAVAVADVVATAADAADKIFLINNRSRLCSERIARAHPLSQS
jgi:hypothetical protein